jgi:hypothetical protein
MASIIKKPSKTSKGVIAITNLDLKSLKNLNLLKEIKKKYILLYHPNYYDYNFKNNGIFDGFLAIKSIFNLKDDTPDKILNFNCHNFSPPSFYYEENKKNYDFISLTKLQDDKNIYSLFSVVKKVLKINKKIKGIVILSVPGKRPNTNDKLIRNYKNYFSIEERDRFEMISLDYNYPYPLNIETISFFYRNSKVLLNTHLKEKHGRAQSYALACQMPIVGFKNLSYLVEKKFRKKPFYYISDNYNEKNLIKLLLEAIKFYNIKKNKKKNLLLAKQFMYEISFLKLKKMLMRKYNLDEKNWTKFKDLDRRLASHHLGLLNTPGVYFQTIDEFLLRLIKKKNINTDEILDDNNFKNKKKKIEIYLRTISYKIKSLKSKLVFKTYNTLRKIKYGA